MAEVYSTFETTGHYARIGRDESRESGDDVADDGWIGVLIDGDAGGGVGHEHVDHACEAFTQAWQPCAHPLGDVHESLANRGGYGELDQRSEVEVRGLEPLAFAMRTRRSPN